ncbi:MAG: CRTAC1 family protein, partial [Verrucomicrobia bacterium]
IKEAWFNSKFARTRGQGMSYGGYEKNRLYLNLGGQGFLEAGWLLGVAVEEDSRNVVAADLDGDGRQDLIVTTFEAWPETRQTIRIFRNETPATGHWLAVDLHPAGSGESPVGAVVTLARPNGLDRRWIVTGDSHRSQHPPVAHFGLGGETNVVSVEVRFTSGRTVRIDRPAVDRVHRVAISAGSGAGAGAGGG